MMKLVMSSIHTHNVKERYWPKLKSQFSCYGGEAFTKRRARSFSFGLGGGGWGFLFFQKKNVLIKFPRGSCQVPNNTTLWPKLKFHI